MGCNCGGAKAVAKPKFQYTSPEGVVRTYNTEIEARAAKVRQGGTYVPVPR